MSEALGREPTADELGEEIGLDGRDIADLKTVAERPCSLDAAISDSDGDLLSELIGDERASTPFESLRDKDMHEKIAGALSVLCERERRIIFARFGLAGKMNERWKRWAANWASRANGRVNCRISVGEAAAHFGEARCITGASSGASGSVT